jgi:hypothetical protein
VLGVEQAADHGLAHAARPDETDLHGMSFSESFNRQ